MSVKYQCFSSVSLMDSSWLKKKKNAGCRSRSSENRININTSTQCPVIISQSNPSTQKMWERRETCEKTLLRRSDKLLPRHVGVVYL